MLPLDTAHDALVVIPTVGDPAVLVHTVERIAHYTDGLRVALVISLNAPPEDKASALSAVKTCEQLCEEAGVDLITHVENQPIGFGAANNRGLLAALAEWFGVPPITIFHNDDAHVTEGWLHSMLTAFSTPMVHAYSDPWNPSDLKSHRPDREAARYGRIGIVGPCSNLVAGIQQVRHIPKGDGKTLFEYHPNNLDGFAELVRNRYRGQFVTADFISGFCVGLSRECLSELMLRVEPTDDGGARLVPCPAECLDEIYDQRGPDGKISSGSTDDLVNNGMEDVVVGPWDEQTYRIAGYEDNDLCLRAELAGWRQVVAQECFIGHVGHQTFDRLFPDMQRGMRNRLAHYEKWASLTNPDRELNLGVVCRVKFEVGHDLHLFKNAIQAASRVCDTVAVLLTNNPLDVTEDASWEQDSKLLDPQTIAFLEACHGKPAEVIAQIMRGWIAYLLTTGPSTRFGSAPKAILDQIAVDVWTQPFNERDERNRTHEMIEDLGADWVLSVDSDEIIENRITRRHFERWMRVPDPGVWAWDQAWINHWDSARLVREDRPWGDAGAYVGGMHGFRLWRLPRNEDGTMVNPRRIISGNPPNYLHCGNVPDHDATAKRVSGLRFRHFGYVRAADRFRKYNRYHRQDPNADPMLTGNNGGDAYGHLIAEEGMRITPFATHNGIGLFMLVYGKESPGDVTRILDTIYGVVDRVVLVWTDPWIEQDQSWLGAPDEDVAAAVAAAEEAQQKWEAIVATLGPDAQHPTAPPRLRLARPGDSQAIEARIGSWPATGPGEEMARAAALYGVEWLHQPLNDNISSARNAGIEALLAAAPERGIAWSVFFDPDEHFPDHFSCMAALRRQAEVTDTYGWMVNFVNGHEDGFASGSQSVRMCRLHNDIKFEGRVHETYDAAFARLSDSGKQIQIRTSAWSMINQGLAGDEPAMRTKLNRYFRLLEQELLDNPHNAAAWVSLGLHFANDDRDDKARECFERGVLCSTRGYLPFRELAFWHLRKGLMFLAESLRRSSQGFSYRQRMKPLFETLAEYAGPMPKLGRGPNGDGPPTCPDMDLPPFEPPHSNLGGFENLNAFPVDLNVSELKITMSELDEPEAGEGTSD